MVNLDTFAAVGLARDKSEMRCHRVNTKRVREQQRLKLVDTRIPFCHPIAFYQSAAHALRFSGCAQT